MTWGEALAGFLASGAFAALANRSFDALARWRAEQREESVEVARQRRADARESTARHRIDDGAHARAESVLERLHDDCRREVAQLRDEVRVERDARLDLAADVARCEERHAAAEERIASLEARSNRPPALEPAE